PTPKVKSSDFLFYVLLEIGIENKIKNQMDSPPPPHAPGFQIMADPHPKINRRRPYSPGIVTAKFEIYRVNAYCQCGLVQNAKS
ncbi:MAG TPA: hypothetical protein QF753_23245, partial [Victivallales bacterium]|nr:hypothetical protein [Victivallales bacterium]